MTYSPTKLPISPRFLPHISSIPWQPSTPQKAPAVPKALAPTSLGLGASSTSRRENQQVFAGSLGLNVVSPAFICFLRGMTGHFIL